MFKIPSFKKLKFLKPVDKKEIVGFDFANNRLKMVYIKNVSYKKQVANALSRDLTGFSDADMAKVIRNSFQELGVQNPYVISIIPSPLVITKNIEIPSTNPKEIREIIDLQAARHTPYAREEIIVDYVDIGTIRQTYTKILLVIITRQIIKRQIELLDKAGFSIDEILFAPESLALVLPKFFKIEVPNEPFSVLHIDDLFTDFSIILKNKILFLRSIPVGVHHLVTEKERYQVRFIDELKRSLEAYQNEDIGVSPHNVVLTGAPSGIKDLEPLLATQMSLTVRSLFYMRDLFLSEKALNSLSQSQEYSFLNVIVPLLVREEMKVNFIPEEIKLKKNLQERGRDLIKTGILVLANFILIFLILVGKIYFRSAYLQNLKNKYMTLNDETRQLEENFLEISTVKNYLMNRGYSLEVLVELFQIAPFNLALNDIRFDAQEKFSVKGTADTMSTVFSFVDNLEKSGYFKNVKTKYTAQRREGTADVTDFEISCLLEKGTTDG